ncbi:MAG: hypothetical protein NPIRA03_40920 [Nitrospirales bacterium]|nr:MAG: hypothetical protein NPIRA03_40920 [Nitrospirales bacterium]
MPLKIFTKRCPEAGQEVRLSQAVRQRIWYLIEESDPLYDPNSYNDWTLCWDSLKESLKKEHGWQDLRAYKSQSEWEVLPNTREFILRGVHRFVLDAVELFHDLLSEHKKPSMADPAKFQNKINGIFEDGNLPWRLLEGRIIKVDSLWLESEIHTKATELLFIRGFDGALAEFQQARSDLTSGDHKGAIHAANLALESTIKAILDIQQDKPGALFHKLIKSGLIPEYHEGFLRAFEDHIVRSVPMARNFEKGVGHGQGIDVNEPPKSLTELAVNLSGVLILFLLKQHLESHPN